MRADTRRAPLRSGSADAILSLGVVEHDEAGPQEGLREIRRLLKPGGLLVLAVPFNNWFRRLVVNRLQTRVTHKRRRAHLGLGFAEYRFTAREVRRHLTDAGFETLATYPNDLRPPKVMGLWVDRDNLITNPFVNPARRSCSSSPAGRAGSRVWRSTSCRGRCAARRRSSPARCDGPAAAQRMQKSRR